MLKAEFPAFQIWREEMPGRARYVARSLHADLNPHTVITLTWLNCEMRWSQHGPRA